MKNKKIWIVFTSIITVVSVLTIIGIVYAAFSQQLNVNGNATVTSSTWKVKFANLGEAEVTGAAKEITAPTIDTDDTKIGDYAVSLTLPGDSVSYTFDVVNEGTFDAQISSVTIPTPSCLGTGDAATNDASNVCNHITYTLKYADGTNVQSSDTLSAGQTKSMVLTLNYSGDVSAEQLPKNDVAINNLSTTIVYSQS